MEPRGCGTDFLNTRRTNDEKKRLFGQHAGRGRRFNAVVKSPLDTDFACGVSPSATALKVSGDMLVIGAR